MIIKIILFHLYKMDPIFKFFKGEISEDPNLSAILNEFADAKVLSELSKLYYHYANKLTGRIKLYGINIPSFRQESQVITELAYPYSTNKMEPVILSMLALLYSFSVNDITQFLSPYLSLRYNRLTPKWQYTVQYVTRYPVQINDFYIL
jgi:hypothetical protein